MKPAAVVFDMDGTLVDNNPYHLQAWQAFYKKRGRELSPEEYKQNINGKRAYESLAYIFNRKMLTEELAIFSDEKESLYRKLYKPNIQPVEGLISFLEVLKNVHIPMAVATSGLPANIDFLFQHLAIRQYFDAVIDASQVTKGKPDPEIFLKAAKSIGADPLQCAAFEDSLAGIAAAKSAGMKVIALTTMQKRENMQHADFIIDNYTQINLSKLNDLWQ